MKSRINNSKAKGIFFVAATFFVVACLTIFLAGCNRYYYWDYDCGWICEDPYVELCQGCGSGQMVIDGEQYDFFTAQANDATFIEFFLAQDGTDAQKLLWRADTVLKNGNLYLTITEDTISDFEGKVLVFEQRIGDAHR